MTLGEKQRLFSRLLPLLLQQMHLQGYECALAEGYVGLSTPKTGPSVHKRTGGHFKKIAQDIDLFKADPVTGRMKWLTKTEDHLRFGEFWESLHPLCRWGGRFTDPPDGNHYSLEDGGVR